MDFKIDPRIITGSAAPRTPQQGRNERDLTRLRESTREFEAIFIMEMFKAMRKTIPEGGLFEKDNATEIYEEMLDNERAKAVAAGDGIGLGKAMFEQMRDLIEKRR
jgi:flagellar protein FlgJ